MKTLEDIYNKTHKLEPKVAWSNLTGGFIEKCVRSEKEKTLEAMKLFAEEALREAIERVKLKMNDYAAFPYLPVSAISSVLEDIKKM